MSVALGDEHHPVLGHGRGHGGKELQCQIRRVAMLQVGALIAAVEEGPVLRTDVATLHGFEAHAGFAYLAPLLADFLALFLVQRAQKVVEVLPAGRCHCCVIARLHAAG